MKTINRSEKVYAKAKVTSHIILWVALLLTTTLVVNQGCLGKKPFVDNAPPEYLVYLTDSSGLLLQIQFQRGRYHNHPLMVFWIEDEGGKYLRTLYVSHTIGKGVFRYGESETGFWMPGEIQRPASLPYWAHKRGIRNEFGNYIPSPKMPVSDAITGPTPKGNFLLKTNTGEPLPKAFVLKMEINQTWDFNEYWTNGKYPGNDEYITSCQPAVVYEAKIDQKSSLSEVSMNPIGHSHFDGSDGSLNTDLSTLTTALEIVSEVKIKVITR